MCDLYEKITSLCKQNGISITTMCKESGLSRAPLSDLKMGRSKTLSSASLSKIANYFGVSIDYLLGNTEQKEKASIPKDEREITLDDFTFAMQNETKDLTDMDKQILLSMARQLNDARKKKNGEPG